MKIEEKAKAYDNALEKVQSLYKQAKKDDNPIFSTYEYLFPELKESEDERMLRVIRLALTDVPEERFTTEGTSLSEVLAWIEKQKEQKPSINIDQLKSLMLQYLQEASNEKDDSDIEADTDKWARKILGYDFEQKPVDDKAFEEWIDGWYNEHHRDGYITMDEREFKNFCRGIRNMYQQKPAEWDEEDESMRKTIIQVLESFVSQADCESNPSLSCSYPTYRREIEWLKSLRPVSKESLQPHWKPSEEQKPETKLTGWVARDRNEEICVYEDYPEKDSKGQFWFASGHMSLDEKSFPDIKLEK